MKWRIEVGIKDSFSDARAGKILMNIKEDMQIADAVDVKTFELFFLDGSLDEGTARAISEKVLHDPINQEFFVGSREMQGQNIEIRLKHGVMDPVALSTERAIRDIGLNVKSVSTGLRVVLAGISEAEAAGIAESLLANRLVHDFWVYTGKPPAPPQESAAAASGQIEKIDILDADDEKLEAISKKGVLSLNPAEMHAIQAYFRKIKRNPTDGELETLAQTWSEHCKHKIFNSSIQFEENGKTEIIDGLFRHTIRKATEEIKKPWLVSVFRDNAGIINFDESNHIAFKVETHNHPSALDPYGGANTGIGGVIRDILGCGLGAKPVFNTDVFCFAYPGYKEALPKGILHPKRIMKGVVEGVRDYGNRMGIPTISGAVLFDDRYLGNPLVYCGTAGIMPKGSEQKRVNPGDLIVVAGGRTGRDGIHGATFSSIQLDESASSSAVQIGNAIEEKKFVDAILKARDKSLFSSITDCGAGGFSSAVGEMGQGTGAMVNLEKAPLKYSGLRPWEIWMSEAQERMVLAVPPEKERELRRIMEEHEVEMTVLGRFTDDKTLRVNYNKKKLAELDMDFLHNGLPKPRMKAKSAEFRGSEPELPEPESLGNELRRVLANENIASKAWVIRQYDHEVQGTSIIKPLTGDNDDGPSDASVVAPIIGDKRGIAVSNGICPKYGGIDSCEMALNAVNESLRNLVAIGCGIGHVAILDNFCAGNPDRQKLAELVKAAKGCYDAAKAYETPFISGKDSFYNEYNLGSRTISIPLTLLISAIGVVEDVSRLVTMDFKKAGSLIYAVGLTKDELGGSVYYELNGALGKNVPKVNLIESKKIFERLAGSIQQGNVLSCHDCSDGGLGVAIAEMAFSGGIGAEVELDKVPQEGSLSDTKLLFSESASRFIAEVSAEKEEAFRKSMAGTVFSKVGRTAGENLVFRNKGKPVVNEKIGDLKEAWLKPLRW